MSTTKVESKVCSRYLLLGLTLHEGLELYGLFEHRSLSLLEEDAYGYSSSAINLSPSSHILQGFPYFGQLTLYLIRYPIKGELTRSQPQNTKTLNRVPAWIFPFKKLCHVKTSKVIYFI